MALLSRKLKNEVAKFDETLEAINLKNININGQKRGCSGFFYNPHTKLYVYVDTEESCYGPLRGQALVRRAKNEHDYHGATNHFVPINSVAYWIYATLKDSQMGLYA